MKRRRFTEEQIIWTLNEAEQVRNIREMCRLNSICHSLTKIKSGHGEHLLFWSDADSSATG